MKEEGNLESRVHHQNSQVTGLKGHQKGVQQQQAILARLIDRRNGGPRDRPTAGGDPHDRFRDGGDVQRRESGNFRPRGRGELEPGRRNGDQTES